MWKKIERRQIFNINLIFYLRQNQVTFTHGSQYDSNPDSSPRFIHTHSQTHTHTYTKSQSHTVSQTHTPTHTHSHTHKPTHTQKTHTYRHTTTQPSTTH